MKTIKLLPALLLFVAASCSSVKVYSDYDNNVDFSQYKTYAFPLDQNRRLAALKLMVSGLKKYGLEERKYGIEFWTYIMTNYEYLLGQSTTVDGGISVKVGDKNMLKKALKKALAAIVHGIKCNYPDTYKQELRDWGFQKEKY